MAGEIGLTTTKDGIAKRLEVLEGQLESDVPEGTYACDLNKLVKKGYALVDSGASNSSEPDAGVFTQWLKKGVPVFTPGGEVKANTGTVRWSVYDDMHKALQFDITNVFHLPKASRLLSVRKLVDKGHSVHFTPQEAWLQLVGGRKLRFTEVGKFWAVQLHQASTRGVPLPGQRFSHWKRATVTPISTTLAHRRLGHASKWQMELLRDLNMVKGMTWQGPFPDNCSVCKAYAFANPSEAKQRDRALEPGELLAFDFWIPPKEQQALYQCKAVLGIRDDATGHAWTFPLTTKADLEKGLELWWNSEVAAYPHIKVKRACCDHENVNLTAMVRDWFGVKGVKFVPSPPHLKGRTNIIEAFWRPLLAMVRKMLGDQDVQKFHYPSAIKKAASLISFLPAKRNHGCGSPYVLWHRRVPDGSHLRVWGSRCHAKITSKTDKLSQQAREGTYLGDDESSAWQVLLDGRERKTITSALVRFDERSAHQKALDAEMDKMAEVSDPTNSSRPSSRAEVTDADVVVAVVSAPRGVAPTSVRAGEANTELRGGEDAAGDGGAAETPTSTSTPSASAEEAVSLTSPATNGDAMVEVGVNAPVPLRRTRRQRFQPVPVQYVAEPASGLYRNAKNEMNEKPAAVNMAAADKHKLRLHSDLINLRAAGLEKYYEPVAVHEGGYGMYTALQGDSDGLDVGALEAQGAGLYFMSHLFPGEQCETHPDPFLAELDLAGEPDDGDAFGAMTCATGDGTHVVTGDETERLVNFIPAGNKEAERSPAWCASAWRQLAKFVKHGSFVVVPDEGQRAFPMTWVRSHKYDDQGNIMDNYSRLAVCGNREVPHVDYDPDDISAQVAEDSSVKIVLALTSVEGWAAGEADADGAFHQGKPSRDTFVRLPWLPNMRPKKGFLMQLVTCVYGKIEAASQFQKKMVEGQARAGQTPMRMDKACFLKKGKDGKLLSVALTHIDDITQFHTSGKYEEVERVVDKVAEVVKMKPSSRRELKFQLQRRVHRLPDGAIAITRVPKIDEATKKFMIKGTRRQPLRTNTDFHTVVHETEQEKREAQKHPLRELVGLLQYIAVDRKDVVFAVNNISRYVSPQLRQLKHWHQAREVAAYLKHTRWVAQVFGRNVPTELKNKLAMYVDSEWCSTNGTRFTHGCYVIMLNGGVVACKSFVIKLVCSSTCEAEFCALSEGCKKLRQLSMFCEELGFPQRDCPVYCDNEAVVQLARDQGPSRGKHIDIRFHFVKDHQRWGFIEVLSCPSAMNPADCGTKVQPLDLFTRHRTKCGLIDIATELPESVTRSRQ